MIETLPSSHKEIQNIESKKVIFFDFFDTLVKRSVHPEHVKRLWARDLALALELAVSTEEIYARRAEIEKELCHRNAGAGHDLEFQYDSMLLEFYDSLDLASKISEQSFIELATAIELNHEKLTQSPIEENVKLLKILSNHSKVYIVSDFYLSARSIRSLCDFHGFSNYVSGVFVSCDFLLTKRSGRLFSKVLDRIGVSAKNVAMYGDNEHSDVNMPKTLGIDSAHLEADHGHYKLHWEKSTNKSGLDIFLKSYQSAGQEPFSWLGSSLFLFIRRLHVSLIKGGHKDVFFLAREGQFLKTLFDLYQSIVVKESSLLVRSRYLMVSRRATYLPSLQSIDSERFERLFQQYRRMSISAFLKSINIDAGELEAAGILRDFDINREYEDFPNASAFRALLKNEGFREFYERERVGQKSGLRAHLKELSPVNEGSIAVVDVGWKGSIQNNLSIALPETVFHGFYFGLVEGVTFEPRNPKHSLMFRVVLGERKLSNIFNENRALFETMLAASHGSTQRYSRSGEAITEENEKEQEQFHSIFKPIQASIQGVFKNICMNFALHWVDDDVMFNCEVDNYIKNIILPTQREMDIFESLIHYENFGFFNYTKFDSNNKSPSLKRRLVNLFQLASSPRAVLMPLWWKPLAFRQMGLSPLKYAYYIYKKHTLKTKA